MENKIEIEHNGKTVTTDLNGIERAADAVAIGLAMKHEAPYLRELEDIARGRAETRTEKKMAMEIFKNRFDGYDEREDSALAALNALREPAPPLVAMMEDE